MNQLNQFNYSKNEVTHCLHELKYNLLKTISIITYVWYIYKLQQIFEILKMIEKCTSIYEFEHTKSAE